MPRTPKYCRYRKDFARVTIGDKTIHLGRHDDPESVAKYKQLIAEWAAAPKVEPVADDEEITVVELIAAYHDYAKAYYGDRPRGHYRSLVPVLKSLADLYGDVATKDFTPRKLKAFRQQYITKGNTRSVVNRYARWAVAAFRWGVQEETEDGRPLVEPAVVQALEAVRPVQKARGGAPDGKPVTSVPDATLQTTLPHLTLVVADMVRLQLLTGMRPGELCKLTPGEVDRVGDVWLYRPTHHKTSHLDHERVVAIGPKAQMILRPYLLRADGAPCFSPREAMKQHLERRHDERQTPMSCGNKPKSHKRQLTKLAARYDVGSYRRAIHRACDRAFPAPKGIEGEELKRWKSDHRWSPNQLRHTAGTLARQQFGLDGAQSMLGHKHARVTEIYAEKNLQMAVEIAARIG